MYVDDDELGEVIPEYLIPEYLLYYRTSSANGSNRDNETSADEMFKSDLVTLLAAVVDNTSRWNQSISNWLEQMTMMPIHEKNLQLLKSSLNETQYWSRSLHFFILEEIQNRNNRRMYNRRNNEVTRVVDEDLIITVAITILGLCLMLIVLSYVVRIFTHEHFRLR